MLPNTSNVAYILHVKQCLNSSATLLLKIAVASYIHFLHSAVASASRNQSGIGFLLEI